MLSRQYFKKADDYSNPDSMPHVQVAQRTRANVGSRIEFLVADRPTKTFALKAMTMEEFTATSSLLDLMYYFDKQFEKPLRRISDVVDGASDQLWRDMRRSVNKINRRNIKALDRKGFERLFAKRSSTKRRRIE